MLLKEEMKLSKIGAVIVLTVCFIGFFVSNNFSGLGSDLKPAGTWRVTQYRKSGSKTNELAQAVMDVLRVDGPVIKGHLQWHNPQPRFFKEMGHPLPKVWYPVEGKLVSQTESPLESYSDGE
jgi:hypothetical protein